MFLKPLVQRIHYCGVGLPLQNCAVQRFGLATGGVSCTKSQEDSGNGSWPKAAILPFTFWLAQVALLTAFESSINSQSKREFLSYRFLQFLSCLIY